MWRSPKTPDRRPVDAGRDDRPIALFLNILSNGGAQRRVATLANRFVALGRAVDIVSFEAAGPMLALLSPAVRVVTLARSRAAGPWRTLAHAGRLRDYLERETPVVVMACVTDVHLTAVIGRELAAGRTPLVLRASRDPFRSISRRRLPQRLAEPFKLRRAAWCYARADAAVALSPSGHKAIRRLIGDRATRIETILNPIIETVTSPAPPRRPADVSLVLGIGRLVKQKDFATLLRAFALVRAERPARLTLLGEGPERRRLDALASRLGITADVRMPGEVEDVPEQLVRANLFVSSSRWEGMQAAVIEALAAGCPVVATDCPGGARDALQGDVLGSLVPVGDPEEMARAMCDQLDRPPDPRVLMAGAMPFTLEGKGERYLALFDSIRAG